MEQTPAEQTAGAVRAELARRRWTGRRLARHMGYSPSTMNRRINGEIEFTITELATIAELLDVPLAVLLPGLKAVA